MPKNERNLKIYQMPDQSDDNTIPRIMVQGKWLKTLGFNVGSRVVVKIDNINEQPSFTVSLV